ncbi:MULTISPECIES: hypothetical protein [Luteibacter]|uniref:DoxX family protein n=1 Tax=Luteibacter flocculans TaxID=2780091 RepID=A0ABY4T3B8_9GAMM|nr:MULTISPECIES: hypothetical protein [Luteibacter]URL57399.1 DoxX family protein [Luteibacter flocculans]SFW33901.1 hypothetical protein SAMN02800691_1171 [Luteibacter sp. UNCMF366Tsu5.1]
MSRIHRYSVVVLRTAFGALFTFSGLNHIFGFWQPPEPLTIAGRTFMAGLEASGFVMPLLGVLFVYAGVALIAARLVPLALLLLAAPVVTIFGYHFVTEGHTLGPHIPLLAVYLLLAWEERAAWRAMFDAERKSREPAEPAPLRPAF